MNCTVCEKKAGEHALRRAHAPRVAKATRNCPMCKAVLCNPHSKLSSVMGAYRGKRHERVCGNCHTHMASETFTPIIA